MPALGTIGVGRLLATERPAMAASSIVEAIHGPEGGRPDRVDVRTRYLRGFPRAHRVLSRVRLAAGCLQESTIAPTAIETPSFPMIVST